MTVFKVGDKARIRKDLKDGEFYDTCTATCCFCNEAMVYYGGKTVVVAEKSAETGFMSLRVLENGYSRNIPWNWSDDMLEPMEEEKKKPKLKVGDKVVIKTTVSNGERIDNVLIQPFMFEQAYTEDISGNKCRKIGIVRRVDSSGKTGDIDFDVKDESVYTWPFEAFDKLDKPPKPSNGKRKKLDSKADYSGYTPKSEFSFYDYLNRPVTYGKFELRNITKIEVTVMSGDETGCFYGVLNGEPWQHEFDANTFGNRFTSYDDGSYTVEGRENIEKWINWSYDPEKAIYAEYSMERMRAFKR